MRQVAFKLRKFPTFHKGSFICSRWVLRVPAPVVVDWILQVVVQAKSILPPSRPNTFTPSIAKDRLSGILSKGWISNTRCRNRAKPINEADSFSVGWKAHRQRYRKQISNNRYAISRHQLPEQQAHTLYREYLSNMMFEMLVGDVWNLPAVTGPVATCSDRGQRPSFSVHLRNAF